MLFICGDTHRTIDIDKLYQYDFSKCTKNDFLVILGDFGGIWDNSADEYIDKLLKDFPMTILFVDGNHENFDKLYQYPIIEWNNGKVHKIRDRLLHLMRGEIFIIKNKRFFVFGGASSIDKNSRVPYISWWQQELPTNRELENALMNLEKYDNKVDYILTHCCSEKTMSKLTNVIYEFDILNKFFNIIEDDVSFEKWYFGHYHIDKDIDSKHSCLYNTIKRIL